MRLFVFQGITGHELCHYFWDVSVRMEWEGTLESTNTVEVVSDDTVITHQTHKRVWPTTQRDAVFWSHIRHIAGNDENSPDMWMVCNYSTDHDKAQVCGIFFVGMPPTYMLLIICDLIILVFNFTKLSMPPQIIAYNFESSALLHTKLLVFSLFLFYKANLSLCINML